jgi:hypothetical protein
MPDDIKLPEPVAWTLQSELDVRASTCHAHLWFSDPVNDAWAPLYTADQLKAAVLADRASKWQPIETAPRDGRYFLAANQWGVWVCQYKPRARSGYVFENPWHSLMLNHAHIDERVRGNRPTHWQPLPAPPEQAGRTENQS